MSRTTVSRLVAILLSLTLLAWEARAQIQPGGGGGGSSSGPTKDAFGTAFPSSGFGSGAVDQHGSMASLTLSNSGNLNVNIAEGGGAGGTSSNYNQAMPSAGTAAGFRTAAGLMASASITNNNALLVEPYGNVSDTTNNALRVNVVAGASGGTSSNFVANMPTAGTAVGFKGPGGRMASASVDNSDRLLVTIGSPTTANQGASAAATNLWPVALTTNADTLVRPGDAANNALRVNIVAGGSTNSTLGTAMPSTGIVAGFKDPLGSLASASVDNAGRQIVTGATVGTVYPGTAVPIGGINANGALASLTIDNSGRPTANQGASSTAVNAWGVNMFSDAGVMVRPGDDTNKALRVNIVAGSAAGGTSSNFGTAFPGTGTAIGFRSNNGGMASASITNLNSIIVVPQTVDGAALNGVTEANYFNTMPLAGTPIALRTPGGLAASASGTNNNGALLVEPVRARAALLCDQTASISTANSGNWQLVASASGQSVVVCGYSVGANTTPVGIKFVGGQTATDKPCSGNSVDLTGVMPAAASGGYVNAVNNAGVLFTAVNHGLCINLSNGAAVGGHLTFGRL